MGWLNWTWPTGTSVRYCFKAALAGLAGFVLSVGDTWSALFGTFSAALVVGESRGEDTGAAVNRVRGTLVGMVVALASVFAELPQLTAVAAGIGATAYLCMGFGWGVSAARVGASLCAAIVLSHSADAFYYTPMRALNTLIGIGCGLAISYFVMPVRGRDALIRSAKAALKMTAKLLESLAGHDQRAVEEYGMAVLSGVNDLDKVLVDARREFGGEEARLRHVVRQIAIGCLGAVTAALAVAELQRDASPEQLTRLQEHALALAARVAVEPPWRELVDTMPEAFAQQREQDAELALHGLRMGLRNVERTLDVLGL